jgi:GNAT superfamily N-acetyltransferase
MNNVDRKSVVSPRKQEEPQPMDREELRRRPIARHGPWPDRRRAQIAYYCGEQRSTERIAQRLFGRSLDSWEYAGLAGAPDDARLEVGTLRGQLYFELREPTLHLYQAALRVCHTKQGPLLIDDGYRFLHPSMQGKHLGRHIFHRQLCYAKALGVIGIETLADRRADDNGYYTWPRFGFDGPLSTAIRRQLPAEIAAARSVLDLVESQNGRRWWRRYGVAILVRFDLAENSRSWRVFLQYLCAEADSKATFHQGGC